MRFSKSIFIIYLMLLNLTLSSQGGFRKRINLSGSYGTAAIAAFETSPDNYLILSKTKAISGNSWDYKLDILKYNAISNVYTYKQIGDTNFGYPFGFNWIRNIGRKIDNNIYISNFAKAKINQYWCGVFIKLDFNGDTIWQKKYTSINEHIYLFQSNKSIDGGFLLSGCCFDSALTISRLLLIKTDANGNELWRKKYNNAAPNYAEGRDVIQDSATKNILITGMRFKGFSNGSQIEEKLVFLTDSLGTLLYDLPSSQLMDNASAGILRDQDNNYYIYGYKNKTYIAPHYTVKPYLLKFKIQGNNLSTIFDKEYNQEYVSNSFFDAEFDKNKHINLIGHIDTNTINNLPANGMVSKFKINSDGELISKKYYNYTYNLNWNFGVVANGIGLTSDGGIIVPVERLLNSSNNYAPIFFVKYDSLGCDTTAAYCATVGFKEQNYQTIDVSIYPQPAKQFLNLQSTLFANKKAQVYINNAIGQICYNASVQFNNGTTQLNLANLPKGIYFLKLVDEDLRSFTSKIVLE
ncbi:MAG: T9SS type A sorting domain-containing protein [Bacteroidetes bacterium]|nr:T9SS type A sorting domain-containing protein [Bacteroidota bacterium]